MHYHSFICLRKSVRNQEVKTGLKCVYKGDFEEATCSEAKKYIDLLESQKKFFLIFRTRATRKISGDAQHFLERIYRGIISENLTEATRLLDNAQLNKGTKVLSNIAPNGTVRLKLENIIGQISELKRNQQISVLSREAYRIERNQKHNAILEIRNEISDIYQKEQDSYQNKGILPKIYANKKVLIIIVLSLIALLLNRCPTKEKYPDTIDIDGDSWTKFDLLEFTAEQHKGLYTFTEAQKVCGSLKGNWRLPTIQEWENLVKKYGKIYSSIEDASDEKLKISYLKLTQGQLQLTIKGWWDSRVDSLKDESRLGYYWSSTPDEKKGYIKAIGLEAKWSKVYSGKVDLNHKISCRCIRVLNK